MRVSWAEEVPRFHGSSSVRQRVGEPTGLSIGVSVLLLRHRVCTKTAFSSGLLFFVSLAFGGSRSVFDFIDDWELGKACGGPGPEAKPWMVIAWIRGGDTPCTIWPGDSMKVMM